MGLLGDATSGTAGSAQMPNPNASVKCGANGCQGLTQEDDDFCRHCGYSRKKCVACGRKLPTGTSNDENASPVEAYCPNCGAARTGHQIIRTSPVSSRFRGVGSFLQYFAAPAAVVLIGALIIAQPTISRSTAQSFFTRYFSSVTAGEQQREQLYRQDLSTSFRQFADDESYDRFWSQAKSVSFNNPAVLPVPGNSSEFTVSLTITYKPGTNMYDRTGGHPQVVRVNYWIVCTGFLGNFVSRFPFWGCPRHDLKFDNEQNDPLVTGNS
jgi:hypothetical protein